MTGQRGSALLITLLLLGVLMTLTLGVSALVIREIRVTQSVVDANKAFYASESGVERSLLGLTQKLAGYEPAGQYPPAEQVNIPFDDQSVDSKTVLLAVDPGYRYEFSTSNQTDSVPGFPDDQPIFVEQVASADGGEVADCRLVGASSQFSLALNKKQFYEQCPRATYRKLGLNETHIIPLFSDDGQDSTLTVNDFLVEYYLSTRDGSDFYGSLQGLKLESFDVLRWKIYGKPLTSSEVQRTESIADFYPGATGNGPDTPVCIGTDATILAAEGEYRESCIIPTLSKKPPSAETLASGENLTDFTLWSAARECYQTDAGSGVTGGALIKGTTIGDFTGCFMRDFVDNHKENYLVLTNMMNPNVVGISNLRDPSQLARANIYYRVLARRPAAGDDPDSVPKLVKDYAEIRGVGYAAGGEVVKSLDVRYKAPGFLPVFNFSLYKTKAEL